MVLCRETKDDAVARLAREYSAEVALGELAIRPALALAKSRALRSMRGGQNRFHRSLRGPDPHHAKKKTCGRAASDIGHARQAEEGLRASGCDAVRRQRRRGTQKEQQRNRPIRAGDREIVSCAMNAGFKVHPFLKVTVSMPQKRRTSPLSLYLGRRPPRNALPQPSSGDRRAARGSPRERLLEGGNIVA